jgi:hypothetical protein
MCRPNTCERQGGQKIELLFHIYDRNQKRRERRGRKRRKKKEKKEKEGKGMKKYIQII